MQSSQYDSDCVVFDDPGFDRPTTLLEFQGNAYGPGYRGRLVDVDTGDTVAIVALDQ